MSGHARSPLAIALWICLLAALVYLLSYSGTLHAVDEQSALSVAESMLLGQGFHTNQMEWDQARTPPQNAVGLDGNLYSKKGFGVSLLALPLFGLGELWVTRAGAAQTALLTGTLVTLLAVWAMFWLARAQGYPMRVAAGGALLLAFGSPLWPYARTLFSEAPGAAGMALALWGIVAWRYRRHTRWLLLAGVGLALLISVKSSNGVVVPLFGLYWLWHIWRRRGGWGNILGEMLALGAPVLLALAGTVAYNYVRFGTLLGFPLEPFETFSTPLLLGLAGLLFSPGKGIFWYFPALWLGVAFVPRWQHGGRLSDYLLAAGAALAIVVVYALWYDWPGGRAWGPRMIVTATPALAMLVLPALDWLVTGRSRRWAKVLVTGVLLVSVAVQLPGVLVNFERQEELDMQAGATFEQLLWSPELSPLLTYWQRIGTAPDPLLLQPYLQTLPTGTLPSPAAALLLAAAVAGVLLVAARQIWHRRPAALWLAAAGLVVVFLAVLLPPLAYADPRWDELSAVREDNRALVQGIRAAWQPGSVVLLDLLESSDKGRRTGQWLNFAGREPYIGWLRVPQMDGAAGERLAAWLAPYRRVWLVLQATDEGDPASTTEAWLNRWAFAGRRWWVGDQRVVEYLAPNPGAAEAARAATVGPFAFGDAVTLHSYWLDQDQASGAAWIELKWSAAGDADTRFSLQVLDAGGSVVAQVDGMPSTIAGSRDRIGLSLPAGAQQLILKVYRAGDGSVHPVVAPGQDVPAGYLPLERP